MDFWVWVVIVFVAWALEALANARKKKRQPPRPPQPPERPAPRPVPQRQPAPRRTGPVIIHAPPERPRLPDREWRRETEGEQEEPFRLEVPVARPPRPRELEPTAPIEGISAEVLYPQHVRALEKYGLVPAQPRTRGHPRQPPRRFANLREAVIWMEILGPPKGGR
jgi:hypothetical protein